MTDYKIKAGDTLTKIANTHNTTVQELARINNISDPNKIIAGKSIKLFEKTPAQPESGEELAAQLEKMNRQLEQTQAQMAAQEQDYNGLEMFGYGVAGAALFEGGKKALPYARKGIGAAAKSTAAVANKGCSTAKHIGKKVELEYAFGKDTVKKGVEQASSKGSKIMSMTKLGKAVGKRLPVIGWGIAAAETCVAAKEGGTKAAVKQGAKSVSGIACGVVGAKIGAMVGACTGPAAVVAVPVLTTVGAVAGYLGGEKLMDKVTSWFN